jgi:hypothetical protein
MVRSQSLNIDQGNSDWYMENSQGKFYFMTQSLDTDQDSSDLKAIAARTGHTIPSQSLNTDQGSSDSTPRKPLKSKELRWLLSSLSENSSF